MISQNHLFTYAKHTTRIVLASTLLAALAACPGNERYPTPQPIAAVGKDTGASVPGGSRDGSAAPSVPTATDALPVTLETKAAAPSASTGGTADMRKKMTPEVESNQMPLIDQGNNHSAPQVSAPQKPAAK